jgi:hypothetical protein
MVGRGCSSGLRVLQPVDLREIRVSDQTYATYDRLRLRAIGSIQPVGNRAGGG